MPAPQPASARRLLPVGRLGFVLLLVGDTASPSSMNTSFGRS